MASPRIFVDTHGFYVWADASDPRHGRAIDLLHPLRRRFVTTEWILTETVNLFVARRRPHWVERLLELANGSEALQVIPATTEHYHAACRVWLDYRDHAFPLTDCTSFVVMRELRLRDALTGDRHFRIMGFHPLLADG